MIRGRATPPQLHLVTDPALDSIELVRRAEAAAAHGVDAVHVRLPDATARQIYDVAVVLRTSLLDSDVRLIVNDRVDVALAVNAAGVQLNARSLPVQAVRRVLGPEAPVGVSVHSVDEAREAELYGASWVTYGHVYETASHPDEAPRGLDQLRQLVEAVDIPVIAIGGITPERVPQVIGAGAAGVAVITGILAAADAGAATEAFRAALDSGNERSDR